MKPIKPFLMNFSNKIIPINDLGGNMDFRQHMINIYGKDIANDDADTILILSRVHDQEADLLGLELSKKGINYIRLNTDDIPCDFEFTLYFENAPKLNLKGKNFSIDSDKIKVVWYRLFSFDAIQTQLNKVLEEKVSVQYSLKEWREFLEFMMLALSNCKWLNHPESISRSNKFYQLNLAKQIGFIFPESIISNDANAVTQFYKKQSSIFGKTASSHLIELDNKLYGVFGHELTEEDLRLSHTIRFAPVIYQKQIRDGSDVRVTIIKDKVFSSKIVNNEGTDWHRKNMKSVKMEQHDIPEELEKKCKTMLSNLNLSYGAFDFLLTSDNKYVFLEVNPTGAWRWVEIKTDNWKNERPITKAIVNHLKCLLEG